MSLIDVVDAALEKGLTFDAQKEIKEGCATFDALIRFCPDLFQKVDMHLFDGALGRFMQENNIRFEIIGSDDGPAGLTTYTEGFPSKMQISLRKQAWQTTFPALVGGNLCHRADYCLIDIFLHEMVHVLCFCIYIQLDMTAKDVKASIPYYYDPTHNVLFTTWLLAFFNQKTVNNSLLLCGTHEPLVFDRDLHETENVCLMPRDDKPRVQIFRNGKKEFVTILKTNTHKTLNSKHVKPHHTHVRTLSGSTLIVPNGLLFC